VNLIDKIKLLWAGKKFVDTTIKEAKMQTESSKPGWKKTEFWTTVFTVHLPTLYGAIAGFIPAEKAAYIHIAALTAFAIFNTIQKGIEGWKNVKSNQATVTTSEPVTTITTPA
jgi:hypothetical protein